jgi:hypothetical protein
MILSITTLNITTFRIKNSAILFTFIKLSVTFFYLCAVCHYAECHYVECHYAECHYAEYHYAEYHYAECQSLH